MNAILEKISLFRGMISDFFILFIEKLQYLTGINSLYLYRICGWLTIVLLIFLIGVPIFRNVNKKILALEKKITLQFDGLIYLLAHTQHQQHSQLQGLGGNPHMELMKGIFKAEGNYLKNSNVMLENIGKVEILLKKKAIQEEDKLKIKKNLKEYQTHLFYRKILSFIIGVPTLGIALLFGQKK